ERGTAHEYDRDQEGVLPSDQIADPSEHDRAERTHQEARRIGGEGGKERRRVVARGKEQRREKGRQGRVQIKVIPLENGAQRGSENDLPLFRADALDRLFLQ